MEDHRHDPETGAVIAAIVEAIDETGDVAEAETVAEAEVQIAEINAERDVALAKEATKREATFADETLAELRGEVRALRQLVDALTPQEPEPVPEPAPVVVEPPAEPAPDVAPPPEVDHKPAPKKKSGMSWF